MSIPAINPLRESFAENIRLLKIASGEARKTIDLSSDATPQQAGFEVQDERSWAETLMLNPEPKSLNREP